MLGFEIAFTYGDPPFYAQVRRGEAFLNLRHVDRMPLALENRADEDFLSATIALDDAATLFAEYDASGVAFHRQLRTEPWGAETFVVADPDGNLILFAGRTDSAQSSQ